MTRTLAILAALPFLASCACGEPGRCQLAPPPGAQSYTPRPVYAAPVYVPPAQHYRAPPSPTFMNCMPTGFGAWQCTGS